MLLDHASRLVVGLVADTADLLVDDARGLGRVVLLGDVHLAAVLAGVVDEAQSVAHAPLEDHGPRVGGDHLDVHARARRDVAGVAALGQAARAEHAHGRLHEATAVAVTVLLGEAEGDAHRLAARDDRDLVQWVGVLEQQLQDGVAGLVVRGGFALLLLDAAALVRASPADLVAGFLEVGVLDEVLLGHGRDDRALVDQRREVGAAEHGRGLGNAGEVHIRPHLHLLRVHGKDLGAALDIGQRNLDRAVESARARERGVEHVEPVGAGDHDDLVAGFEAVHLDEDRIEGLLTLIMAAAVEAAAATATNRIDLVEEDDAGGVFLRLLEEVADAARAHADEHLDEVRARDREEGGIGLASNRLGEHRLAAAGRAREQHAARDSAAQARELLGVLEELDDLADFLLGFLDAGHVLERDAG